MKKTTLLLFLLLTQLCLGQNPFNNILEDTISIEDFAKKVELENDLAKSEQLNNILLNEIIRRKNIKTTSEIINNYYENAYLATLLSKAYFDNKRGDYKTEIAVYFKILKNKHRQKDKTVLCYTYNAIAMSFSEIKEYPKSIYYCEKAIELSKKNNNNTATSAFCNNLGELYSKKKQLDKALLYFQQSEFYGKKSYNKSILGSTYNNIGTLYYKRKEYLKAIENYKKGILIAIDSKDDSQLSFLYFNMADVYQKSGDKSLFEKYKIKSFQLAQSSKDLMSIKNSAQDLYEIYKSKNNFSKALYYYEKSNEAKAILEKGDNKNLILKAEFKYDSEKKEAKIKNLYQEKKIANLQSERQKNIVIALIIFLILISVIAYFLFNRFKTKKQNELLKIQLEEAEKTIEAEKKAAESELKALKSQMNPHFIFNALNGIQEQFMFGNKEVANEQMGNFTYLTRQILTVSGKKKIPVATEIEILTKYLELEKMRFHKDFEYEINLDENIDDYYTQIPPMLIQPFVENSIKHGLLHREGSKKVSVDFTMNETESAIICTIVDNGIGRGKSAKIKAKNDLKHESFSTQSIDQRLEIWNEGIGNAVVYEDILNLDYEVAGTKVVLTIAIH